MGVELFGVLIVKTQQSKEILPAAKYQTRPILASGGHRIVITIDFKVYVLNWDGSDKRFGGEWICFRCMAG